MLIAFPTSFPQKSLTSVPSFPKQFQSLMLFFSEDVSLAIRLQLLVEAGVGKVQMPSEWRAWLLRGPSRTLGCKLQMLVVEKLPSLKIRSQPANDGWGRILLSSGVSAHVYQSVISMPSTAFRNSLWQESRLVFTTAQNEIIGNVNNLVSPLSV